MAVYPVFIWWFGPAIASYIVLKKNNEVMGFKEWLKNVFDVKSPIVNYLLIILLLAVYFIPRILIAGLIEMYPIYIFFVSLPAMLVGGGMEEAGWRYIFHCFFPDVVQYGANFGLFFLQILGSSFVMGAIRKISGKVFLCVFAHSLANAGLSTFIANETFLGNFIPTILVIIISTIVVHIHGQGDIYDRQRNQKEAG